MNRLNLMTWVGNFAKWSRPFVVKFCDLHSVRPGARANLLMLYLAAKGSDDPDMQQFCKLYELKEQEAKDRNEQQKRNIDRISKALRNIEKAISESSVV